MSFEQMLEDDILEMLHNFGCAGGVVTTEHIGYDVYKPTAAIVALVREIERRTQAVLEQPAQEVTRAPQADAPGERELFEADWSRRNAPVPIDLRRLPDGRYGDHVLEAQWQTWQAARAVLATQQAVQARTAEVRHGKLFHRDTFDAPAWVTQLTKAVEARGMTWAQVSEETGVSTTTLSRVRSGERRPDAASLAALSAWAGINPANYCATQQAVQAEPVAVAHKGRHVGSAGVHISRLAALDELPDGVHKLYTATPPTPGQVGALRSDMAGGPVQRYRLYEGGHMEPYIGGDWVTYADVCATFSAPRQVERNREDAEQLAGNIAYQLTKRLVIDMPTARAAVDDAIRSSEGGGKKLTDHYGRVVPSTEYPKE